jgi:hypothetical protein
LQPTAIVILEQIAQDRTSGLLARIDADILRTAIGPTHCVLVSIGSGMARHARSG